MTDTSRIPTKKIDIASKADMERLVRLRGSYDGALAGMLRDRRTDVLPPPYDSIRAPRRTPSSDVSKSTGAASRWLGRMFGAWRG